MMQLVDLSSILLNYGDRPKETSTYTENCFPSLESDRDSQIYRKSQSETQDPPMLGLTPFNPTYINYGYHWLELGKKEQTLVRVFNARFK